MWWYIIKLGSDFIWYLFIRWTKKSHFLFFYQWSLYVNWPYIHSVCCNLKLVDFANHESVLYILVKFTFNYKIQEKLTQFFHYFNIIFISSLDRNSGHLWPKENKYMIQVYISQNMWNNQLQNIIILIFYNLLYRYMNIVLSLEIPLFKSQFIIIVVDTIWQNHIV